MNSELQELIDMCNGTKDKILSYVECSAITDTPRAVVRDENGDICTVAYSYEYEVWSID